MQNLENLLKIDRDSIWHPYTALASELPVYHVDSADGVRLKLSDGRELIDGMSSWWSVIHGYNQPEINKALEQQLKSMAHVMFGGLTHTPAIELTEQLLAITPEALDAVFYSDSGSVSVEVAMKMAIQYWQAKGAPQRQKFISLRHAYHGDTFGAMSVCDPETGMHSLFADAMPKQVFIEQPQCRFGEACTEEDMAPLKQALIGQSGHVAALIMEPIVQGAGGMWFYSADYLKQARELCSEHNVLLILDEVATGFGRTGKLFACEHADVVPDIMCVGKALTGGYLSLAATLSSKEIHQTIDNGDPGVFMHGPTFMANPLACTAALTSIRILLASNWQENIRRIQQGLEQGLQPCKELTQVSDVRVLGGIGVVELNEPVDMKTTIPQFVEAGVWVRPFGKLVYLMPPYIIEDNDLKLLTDAIVKIISAL
ncbi:MAG TPA: adenosylmethionine--8-amino-7-oxononanoate transaminase [Thiotrichaceae bacterium]|jgi:adenosylmethionine-8-amino-7-oxononanoate aminotransferase|nr:adenosylmethionine--8-amino-7-oxononanoate transaminase [Thiotrichaceae bacterium]HIM08500.1 adenosylmethionine--8-amino-7-oxononanoate transaminase [Gammaproteobacteria bacterium]